MTIQEINSNLQIVKIDGKKFGNKDAYIQPKGYAFFCGGLGYLTFIDDYKKGFPKKPYAPNGGKNALQEILDCGGFLDYEGIEWIQELII